MNILLLEPFFTGSHRTWAEDYARYSEYHVELLTLGGHYWKWRMHGGAVTLARKFMEDFARYENEMPENMRTMLVDVLSLDDSFDMLEEFRFSI